MINTLFLIISLLFILIYIKINPKQYDNFRSVLRRNLVIKKDKIIKKHKCKKTYNYIKKIYHQVLYKFDFVPRMEFNDNKLEITEELVQDILTEHNKPIDFDIQLRNIAKQYRKNNLFHNCAFVEDHFRVKNDKIYMIDFEKIMSTTAPIEREKGEGSRMRNMAMDIEDIIKKFTWNKDNQKNLWKNYINKKYSKQNYKIIKDKCEKNQYLCI